MNRIPSGGARRILARLSSLALLAASCIASLPAQAAVLGTDDRNGASAFMTEAQQSRFEGVGRIECLDGRGVTAVATGWVVASADTVMTAAHSFFLQDRKGEWTLTLDPRNCMFVLYNADRSVREFAHVAYGLSPWADASLRGDSSNDFAVLKLDRTLRVTNIPTLSGAARANAPVQLIAFQSGVSQGHRARVTRGESRQFPAMAQTDLDRARVSSSARLFSTSASSSSGSSGGLYYDGHTGSIVGMHLGSMCDTAVSRPVYDPARCFNVGLRFDRKIRAFVDAIVRGASPTQHLITREITAPNTLAMLPSAIG
jgi:hypothetical protein